MILVCFDIIARFKEITYLSTDQMLEWINDSRARSQRLFKHQFFAVQHRIYHLVDTRINNPTAQSFSSLILGCQDLQFTSEPQGITENDYFTKQVGELSQLLCAFQKLNLDTFSNISTLPASKDLVNLTQIPNSEQGLIAVFVAYGLIKTVKTINCFEKVANSIEKAFQIIVQKSSYFSRKNTDEFLTKCENCLTLFLTAMFSQSTSKNRLILEYFIGHLSKEHTKKFLIEKIPEFISLFGQDMLLQLVKNIMKSELI